MNSHVLGYNCAVFRKIDRSVNDYVKQKEKEQETVYTFKPEIGKRSKGLAKKHSKVGIGIGIGLICTCLGYEEQV